jgi:predicted TIM-barrel fold metal-dependent hydrolase
VSYELSGNDQIGAGTAARLTRRTILGAGSAALLAQAQHSQIPIIDTHIHLYDPTRPQSVPYPSPTAPTALPDRYRADVSPLGIVGGIKVEASPWVEDNLWVLDLIANHPFMVGMIGNLDPMKPEFREYLERYHRNKLFLGIRYGNIWHHNLVAGVQNADFIDNIKEFSKTGLTFETANPKFDLIEAALRLTDKVPDLRVVLGHLPALELPTAPDALRTYSNNLRELRKRNVYAKLSALMKRGQEQNDPAQYKPMLDFMWDIFGEDRVVYASGWPSPLTKIKAEFNILQPYFSAKGKTASEKFFWKNSVGAFKWVKREPSQPG